MITTLTDEERAKFADWLACEAATADALATQMAKVSMPAFLVGDMRRQAMSMKIVEARLRRTETTTLEGEDRC